MLLFVWKMKMKMMTSVDVMVELVIDEKRKLRRRRRGGGGGGGGSGGGHFSFLLRRQSGRMIGKGFVSGADGGPAVARPARPALPTFRRSRIRVYLARLLLLLLQMMLLLL